MTDETNIIESGSNVESGVDYIEAINQLKQNTVAKEEYDKLKGENQKLLKSLINGETIAVEEKPVDVGELCKDLCTDDCDFTNLNYIQKRLELRDAIMAQGGPDTLVPYGRQISPTQEDLETADRIATVLKECIDYADGDSAIFTSELMRRTADIPNPTAKARKK